MSSDTPKVVGAPERIYLQIGDDFIDGEEILFDDLEEVTWCQHNIMPPYDIEYVRADIYERDLAAANAEREELRKALELAIGYISPRVTRTGGHGETVVLPQLRAAIDAAIAAREKP